MSCMMCKNSKHEKTSQEVAVGLRQVNPGFEDLSPKILSYVVYVVYGIDVVYVVHVVCVVHVVYDVYGIDVVHSWSRMGS